MTLCMNCKWCVFGKYSAIYGGRPIGCCRPLDAPRCKAESNRKIEKRGENNHE